MYENVKPYNDSTEQYSHFSEEEKKERRIELEMLADAFFENLEHCDWVEFGGWGLNDKRPFGNSNVERDILEIIGLEEAEYESEEYKEQRRYARELYNDLGPFILMKWNQFRKLEKQSK